MATLEDLKIQIENANALGRTNLSEKGIELSETATTYKIMQNIGNVLSVGDSLNIAYGETAPIDKSKLWIKSNKPTNVKIDSDLDIIERIKTSNTHLPVSNSSMGCASIGNKIYLFGGSSSSDLNTINVFNTETETITTLSATLPTACYDMGCASIGNKIYLFGGDSGSGFLNTINVFNTETEIITTLSTTLPKSCHGIGCAAVGTKIYLFGGWGGSSQLNTINIFNTETETITTLSATLPTACYGMGCAAVGTKIYLFGGDNGFLDTINVFDTTTETITTLSTTLPDGYYDMGCTALGTKIYLFGGNGSGPIKKMINMFDTTTETISTLSKTLPDECIHMGCATVGNKIYLLGGYNSYSGDQNTINIFDIIHQLTQGNIKIQSGSLTNKFNLINTKNTQIKIGVENVYIGNANNEAKTVDAFLFVDGEWKQISYGA